MHGIRIADPVHGTIELSPVEADVIDTAAFHRLRNVKQLGFANFVYPGADYSRFLHSVGVCHVVGRMAERLLKRKTNSESLNTDDCRLIQKFRLAGLLHDIGHYPFSHATQDAIENHYADTQLTSAEGQPVARAYKHEQVGAKIIELDGEVRDAIGRNGYDPDEISKLFRREEPGNYSNLLASDLDADRLDFLMRTSHFSGLPYGSIDLDYIVSQVCEDNNGKACLTYKALRAADHLLVSRILDYRQIPFHKAVVAYEWLLKDVIEALLRVKKDLILSTDGVDELIRSGKWCNFTDSYLLEQIQTQLTDNKFDDIVRQKAEALLGRWTPKLVGEIERFVPLVPPGTADDSYNAYINDFGNRIGAWESEFGIHKKLWCVWYKRINLTTIGSQLPVGTRFRPASPEELDEFERMIRLANPGDVSTPIVAVPRSLTSLLANYNIEMIRIYALLPRSEQLGELRAAIHRRILDDFPHRGWTD